MIGSSRPREAAGAAFFVLSRLCSLAGAAKEDPRDFEGQKTEALPPPPERARYLDEQHSFCHVITG